ncbi:MAG TPA: hypothetical protein VFZ25_04830 [Chloroflexota bacterium]|nr:hypothetical protein [Chloroflexota bacterium]
MPTGITLIADGFGVVLIVLGVAAASIADDLLFVVSACFLQFMGEVFVLLATGGLAAAASIFVLGAGCLAILIGGQALRPGPSGRTQPRAFDLSVAALAVAGAVGLAVTRPPLPDLPADVAFVTLILGGLLFCLLGGTARLACGLIFLTSGVGLLLQVAEPNLGFPERLLLAAAELCLVLALSALWTVGEDPNLPRPRRYRARSNPVREGPGDNQSTGSVSG